MSAEITLTREQWEAVVDLYTTYGYRPTNIARKLHLSFDIVKRLWEESVNGLPPIEPIVKARREAKKQRAQAQKDAEFAPISEFVKTQPVINLHVAPTPSPAHTAPHTDTPERPSPASTPSQATAEPTPAPHPSGSIAPAPLPPLALAETGNSAADLAAALEHVHRELARALPREARLVAGLREQAIGLANGGTQAVRAFEAVMKQVTARILKAAERDEFEERRAFTVMTRLSRLVKVSTEHAKAAIELQRLIAGLPQTINASVTADSGKDHIDDLKDLTKRLEDMQRRRGKVIDAEVTPYAGEESGDGPTRK